MKLIPFLLRMAKNTGRNFYNFIASRERSPIQNIVILLFIFLASCINYFHQSSGGFIFEIELLNLITLHFTMLIPLVLLFNSLLFKKVWLKVLSGIIFIIPAVLITLIFYPNLVAPRSQFATKLVRRFPESKEYIISVYEYTTHGFHDNGDICRTRYDRKRCYLEFSGMKRQEL